MKQLTSESISDFLNFLTEVKTVYRIYKEELQKQEKLTQDFLHSLELDNLNCAARSKVATRLAINRKDRRYYKDVLEELEPIFNYITTPEHKKVFDKLTDILGASRKIEGYHKNRTYKPKVLPEIPKNK